MVDEIYYFIKYIEKWSLDVPNVYGSALVAHGCTCYPSSNHGWNSNTAKRHTIILQ